MDTQKHALNDKDFLKSLKKQNNEFLQKVKGLQVFTSEDTTNTKPIANFSANGKQFQIYEQWTAFFDQSPAPNLGFYRMDFDSSRHYVGILFYDGEIFMYSPFDFDELFKINGIRIYLAK